MTSRFARADFFDASALVCVFSEEPISAKVRSYFDSRTTRYTTPYCFYEAMNILKGKWKYKAQISLPTYLRAAEDLATWYGASSRKIRDLEFSSPEAFGSAREIAERYSLDLSDAFQIVSVKQGYFSHLARESQTVLVTADQDLANAACAEGLRVWNARKDPAPE